MLEKYERKKLICFQFFSFLNDKQAINGMEFYEKHSSIIIFRKTSTTKGGRGNICIEFPLINSINNTLSILGRIFHIDDTQIAKNK